MASRKITIALLVSGTVLDELFLLSIKWIDRLARLTRPSFVHPASPEMIWQWWDFPCTGWSLGNGRQVSTSSLVGVPVLHLMRIIKTNK